MQARPSIEKVIEKRFCIGCGACSAIDPAFKVELTANEEFRVQHVPAASPLLEAASRVCPMGDSPNEDQLAETFFPSAPHYSDGIGRYEYLYAGHSRDFRSVAGSGGVTRWLMAKLLQTGAIEYIVEVDRKLASNGEEDDLFTYFIHDDSETYLQNASTSAYYPVTMQEVLKEIRSRPGRCAVTALPCFSRALRALMVERPAEFGHVAYISGVICGGLKSGRYAQYLGQQMGTQWSDMHRINFRGKGLSTRANEKCVEVWDKSDPAGLPAASARVQDLKGTNYGLAYFKPKACDYCDDVMAETADIAFGDAWIEPYASDPSGTNVIVLRNPDLAKLLEESAKAGELTLNPLSAEQVKTTQGGGLRHRRKGLELRLKAAQVTGSWVPKKRVAPRWGSAAEWPPQLHRVGIRVVTGLDSVPPEKPLMMKLVGVVERAVKLMKKVTGEA